MHKLPATDYFLLCYLGIGIIGLIGVACGLGPRRSDQ